MAVATGDEGTGKSNGSPRTKYAKGPATVAAVLRNRTQREFWESDAEEATVPNPTAQTWFLLRNRIDETVYANCAPSGNRRRRAG